MTIQQIKNNYLYKYPFVDIEGYKEVKGYIYDISGKQYFINNKETYFKEINNK